MFSSLSHAGTHFTSGPSQSLDELPVHDRQTVADVRPYVLARDRVPRSRRSGVLDRRAGGFHHGLSQIAPGAAEMLADMACTAMPRVHKHTKLPSLSTATSTLRRIVVSTRMPGTDITRAAPASAPARRGDLAGCAGMNVEVHAAASSAACCSSVFSFDAFSCFSLSLQLLYQLGVRED